VPRSAPFIAFDLVRGDSARNREFALPTEIMNSEFLQLTYSKLKRSAYRVIVMAWGESIHYQAPSK
jgi:hypothetical protein